MKSGHRLAAALLSVLPLAAHAVSPAADPARALHQLFDEAWEADLRANPLAATYLGDHRFDNQLPEVSAAAIARREGADAAVLQRLKAIDRSALDAQDQLNYTSSSTTTAGG